MHELRQDTSDSKHNERNFERPVNVNVNVSY